MYMYIYYYTTTYSNERTTNEQGIRRFAVQAKTAMSNNDTHLSDHTDADAETNARAKVIIRNLLHGRGYDDRLTQSALATQVNDELPGDAAVSTSTVRSLVRRVRAEYNLAIYSRGSGYYHIQTDDALDDALGRIDEAIATKEETKTELAEAFSKATRAPATDGGGVVAAGDIRREIAAVADAGNDRNAVESHVERAIGVDAERVAEEIDRMETNGFVYVADGEVRTP